MDGREESEPLELIGTNKKAARENFETYFLVLETLEEKQVHIVKQVVQKIRYLVKISSAEDEPSFHSSWTLILFLRMFQHPNMSLVGWGLQLFLQTKFSHKTLTDQNFLSFLCNPFLDVLNETKVYSRDQTSGETVALLLAEFLSDCRERLHCEAAAVLMRTFVTAVATKSWGPIPLTWVSFGLKYLSERSPGRCLTGHELTQLKVLVTTGLQYQEPLLRAAAMTNFCLFVTSNLDPSESSWEQLASFLHVFLKRKVLFCSHDSNLWRKVAHFVTEEFLGNDFNSVISRAKDLFECLRKQSSESTKVLEARVEEANLMLVLFIYHKNFETELISKIRNDLFVKSEPTRVYEGDRFKYNDEEWSRVELLHVLSLYGMFQPVQRREGKPFLHFSEAGESRRMSTFYEQFGYSPAETWSVGKQAVDSLLVLLEAGRDVEDVARVETYTALLTSVVQSVSKDDIDSNYVLQLLDRALAKLDSPNTVIKMMSMKTLVMFSRLEADAAMTRSVFMKIKPHFGLESISKTLLTESQRDDIQNREEQKIWGKLSGEFTALQLQMLIFLIENNCSLLDEIEGCDVTLELLADRLQTGGRECVVPCLALALSLHTTSAHFLDTSRNFIFEFRKNEIFWPSLSLLVKLCLKNLVTSAETAIEIFLQLIAESENVGGIFPLLMLEMEQFAESLGESQTGAGELLLPVLARGLTYGPVYRRDQRLLADTSRAVFALGEDCEANRVEGTDHMMEAAVRVNAIKTLLHLLKHLSQKEKSIFVFRLFSELQNINTEVTGKKVRHFENSNIHKVRQRLYQNYLIFSVLLDSEHKQKIIEVRGHL